MKSVFIYLLLVSWLTLETCQDITDVYFDYEFTADYEHVPVTRVSVPPNITVYQQVDNREHVIVMCTFESGIHWFGWRSCELSVKTEHNYTLDQIRSPIDDVNLFVVTVNPPVSFTCMYLTDLNDNITYSETYIFDQSGNLNIQLRKGSDHHGEGVSSVYIGFVSFIVLGLIIMIAAVILSTIKSNTKGASPNITVITNDYEDA